jgi:hypothetical protein
MVARIVSMATVIESRSESTLALTTSLASYTLISHGPALPVESLRLLAVSLHRSRRVKKRIRRLSGIGATEDRIDLRETIGQRIDKKGTRVDDEAGTGEIWRRSISFPARCAPLPAVLRR